MATASKTLRTLVAAGTSNAAGGTTTGATWTLTTALGGVLVAKITNGGTGPTAAGQLAVQVSGDGSSWAEFSRQSAGTSASTAYAFAVDLPPGVLYARPVFDSNTGQAVTVEAAGHELTSIG